MFKQYIRGFRRKTLPFSILVGFFLLTISYYEAVWGTPYAVAWSFLVPAVLFGVFTLYICMLSFVSYEYRLMHNTLFVRARLWGKPVRAISVVLDKRVCKLYEPYRWQGMSIKHKHYYYLPMIHGNRRCLLQYQDTDGCHCLIFRPCSELLTLMRPHLMQENAPAQDPEGQLE